MTTKGRPATDTIRPMSIGVGRWQASGETLVRSWATDSERLHWTRPLSKSWQLEVHASAQTFDHLTVFLGNLEIEVRRHRWVNAKRDYRNVFDEPCGWIAHIKHNLQVRTLTLFDSPDYSQDDSKLKVRLRVADQNLWLWVENEIVLAVRCAELGEHLPILELDTRGPVQFDRITLESIQRAGKASRESAAEPIRGNRRFEVLDVEHSGWRGAFLETSPGIDSDRIEW